MSPAHGHVVGLLVLLSALTGCSASSPEVLSTSPTVVSSVAGVATSVASGAPTTVDDTSAVSTPPDEVSVPASNDDATSSATTAGPATTTVAGVVGCGTVDLGGGLVVQRSCDQGSAGEVEGGALAAPNSVLTLPEPSFPDLENVDVTARQAPTLDGHLVTIYIFGSDTLFDSGSAVLRSTATPAISGALASIEQRFPAAAITVRGHADSVGSAAANRSLSLARAQAVVAFLGEHGVAAASLTAVGLGSDAPAALETDASGAPSDLGRQLNRRIELVVVT